MLDMNYIFNSRNTSLATSLATSHRARRFCVLVKNTTICFYAILSKTLTWHITCDNHRHQQAANHIDSRELCFQQPVNMTITPNDLKKILRDKAFFPPYSSSPFLIQGTPFQKQVWNLIEGIPFGSTRTYGELAKQLGNTNFARAVGRACNSNPLALLIPCHRVVGKNTLGGFAGGSEIKEQLLELEK